MKDQLAAAGGSFNVFIEAYKANALGLKQLDSFNQVLSVSAGDSAVTPSRDNRGHCLSVSGEGCRLALVGKEGKDSSKQSIENWPGTSTSPGLRNGHDFIFERLAQDFQRL